MKELFLRFCRWALPLLGITGVVSCEVSAPVMYGTVTAEYGLPTMDYRVTGTVTDSQTGEPVKGIKVDSETLIGPQDPVITSETGEFVYEDTWYPHDKITLQFTDIDPLEDGSYMPRTVEVELKRIQDGDGHWYDGMYVAEGLYVTLDQEDQAVAEYGCPIVEFSVKGRVVDAESNPIQNIEISHPGTGYYTRTSEDGSFEYEGCLTGFELSEVKIVAQDTDGDENGGDFQSQEVSVPVQQTGHGDGHWDNGKYSAENVEIVLAKK
jgi:putative lipoprotein (rSAM/lipoprotein system)